ncbi:MAG: radical SAM protein [Anaerolineaceae bacterium]
MTWKVAKRALDFLWEHSIDSGEVNVGFYGGEPLLEFPLIQKVVGYSKYLFWGKQLTFSITTNGTLLNPEIILFFQEHNFSLGISLDGPKEINDRNRVFANGKGTFDSVLHNINLLSVNRVKPPAFRQAVLTPVVIIKAWDIEKPRTQYMI